MNPVYAELRKVLAFRSLWVGLTLLLLFNWWMLHQGHLSARSAVRGVASLQNSLGSVDPGSEGAALHQAQLESQRERLRAGVAMTSPTGGALATLGLLASAPGAIAGLLLGAGAMGLEYRSGTAGIIAGRRRRRGTLEPKLGAGALMLVVLVGLVALEGALISGLGGKEIREVRIEGVDSVAHLLPGAFVGAVLVTVLFMLLGATMSAVTKSSHLSAISISAAVGVDAVLVQSISHEGVSPVAAIASLGDPIREAARMTVTTQLWPQFDVASPSPVIVVVVLSTVAIAISALTVHRQEL